VIGKLREISTRSNALDIKHNLSKEGKSKDSKNADNSIYFKISPSLRSTTVLTLYKIIEGLGSAYNVELRSI